MCYKQENPTNDKKIRLKKRKSYKKEKNVTKIRYAGRMIFELENVLCSFGGKRT